jgi:site-specific DNA-methyltransferase (adenine-specific)
MKDLPDKSVDCFICDLPYGQLSHNDCNVKRNIDGFQNGGKALSGCPWDIKIDLKAFWEQVERLAKADNTPVIHFCNTKFGIDLIISKPDWFKYDLIWNKDRGVSFLLANKMPMKSHEMIYIFSKKGAYYKRIDDTGEFKGWNAHETKSHTRTVIEGSGKNIAVANDGTTRCVKSVITIKKPNTKGHPTEKPKELYEWLLKRYCPEGGTVLDPTAGSFNSIEVAKELGLKGIGIEKDRAFFWKAVSKF